MKVYVVQTTYVYANDRDSITSEIYENFEKAVGAFSKEVADYFLFELDDAERINDNSSMKNFGAIAVARMQKISYTNANDDDICCTPDSVGMFREYCESYIKFNVNDEFIIEMYEDEIK